MPNLQVSTLLSILALEDRNHHVIRRMSLHKIYS